MVRDVRAAVEWADKLLPLLPAARTIHVHLSGLGDEPREIVVDEPGGS